MLENKVLSRYLLGKYVNVAPWYKIHNQFGKYETIWSWQMKPKIPGSLRLDYIQKILSVFAVTSTFFRKKISKKNWNGESIAQIKT